MKFLVCDVSFFDTPELIAEKFVSYEEGDYHWDEQDVHFPISWHSYAAAMHGRYVCAPNDNWTEHLQWADCILLISNLNQKIAHDIATSQRLCGKTVIGAFHENFDYWQYLAKQNLEFVLNFRNFANACKGFLTYPYQLVAQDVWRGIGITTELLNFKQPYHLSIRNQFILPSHVRKGIFVGPSLKTNEVEKRNWLYNIAYAINAIKQKGIYPLVTTINQSNHYSNEKLSCWLKQLDENIEYNVVSKMPYIELLHTISNHEWTINADDSQTQGQMDYDSLFVDVPLLMVGPFKTDIAHEYANNKHESITTFLESGFSFDVCRKQITNWYKHRL